MPVAAALVTLSGPVRLLGSSGDQERLLGGMVRLDQMRRAQGLGVEGVR